MLSTEKILKLLKSFFNNLNTSGWKDKIVALEKTT